MRKFISADVLEINLEETAFGPYNPTYVDSEKTQVDYGNAVNENGPGYEELHGTKSQYEGN